MAVGVYATACSSSDDPPGNSSGGSTGGNAGSGGSSGSGGSAGSTGGSAGAGGGAGSGGSAGSDGGTASCDKKFKYATYTPGTAARTFTADVFPILQANTCGQATVCHGATKITPVLTPATGTASAMQLQAALTQLLSPSKEAANTQIVKPNQPENSYLMDKLDGSESCAGTCTKHPGAFAQDGCGTLMPQGATDPIDIEKRNIVRDWIKQGAKL